MLLMFVFLDVTVEGYKDILNVKVGTNETSKFWLELLNNLKNRGVKDVLFFCVDVDGLPGSLSAGRDPEMCHPYAA